MASEKQAPPPSYNVTFKDFTNVWVFRDSTRKEALLGMKKRDFGKGYWNGFGGKVEEGETVEEAAGRELHEESGVTPTAQLIKRGVVEFVFSEHVLYKDAPAPPIRMHLFEAQGCSGDPVESDEMRPQWWDVADIPGNFDNMWEDDRYWWAPFMQPFSQEKGVFTAFFRFEQQREVSAYRIFYEKTGEVVCQHGDQRAVRWHGPAITFHLQDDGDVEVLKPVWERLRGEEVQSGKGGKKTSSRAEQLSKRLAFMLRHKTKRTGAKLRDDGYERLGALLKHADFQSFSLEEALAVVFFDDKGRFTVIKVGGDEELLIRAERGHSSKFQNRKLRNATTVASEAAD